MTARLAFAIFFAALAMVLFASAIVVAGRADTKEFIDREKLR